MNKGGEKTKRNCWFEKVVDYEKLLKIQDGEICL